MGLAMEFLYLIRPKTKKGFQRRPEFKTKETILDILSLHRDGISQRRIAPQLLQVRPGDRRRGRVHAHQPGGVQPFLPVYCQPIRESQHRHYVKQGFFRLCRAVSRPDHRNGHPGSPAASQRRYQHQGKQLSPQGKAYDQRGERHVMRRKSGSVLTTENGSLFPDR